MPGLIFGTVVLGVWCLAIAVGLGFGAAGRLAPRSGAATRVALAFLLGAAGLSYSVLALGLAGRLRPLDLLCLLLVLTTAVVWHRKEICTHLRAMTGDLAQAWHDSEPIARALMIVAGVLTVSSLVIPLLPVTNADALAYATAVPQRYAQDGWIRFYPDSYDSAFVMLNETLHAIGYSFHVRPTGVWFEVAAQFLLFYAAADCYRAICGDACRGRAYLFGAALLVMPLTQLMPFMVKAHLVELLAIVVALTLVLEAPDKGGWAGVGAALGVCAATKYTAALGLMPLLVPVALVGVWRSRAREGLARELLAASALGLAIAAPFYVRNYVWTGNPVFPMPFPGLTSALALRHHATLINSVYEPDFGFGRGPLDLLLWWPRAAILRIRGSASYIGTFALAFLPLVLLRPRPKHAVAVTLGFLASTAAMFVLGAQLERFFIAAVAAMTVLATAAWDACRTPRRTMYWAGGAVLLALGACLTFPLKAYGLVVHAPALVSAEHEAGVLAATTPWYADFVRLRAEVEPHAPILCLFRNCQYLANHRREDLLFRLAESSEQVPGRFDPRPVWQGLQAAGIRHIVAFEPEGLSGDAPKTVVGWLARCGGRIVYRNPAARFGTRDPRRVSTAVLVMIALDDRLSADAAARAGPCGEVRAVW